MRWLTDLDTVSAGLTLQANHYTFDLIGNILTAANEIPIPAPVPANGPIAPGPTTQTFTYDKLYQLTGATGRYDGCACGCNNHRQYTFSQTYDEISNIKSKVVTDNIYWPNGQVVAQPKTTYNNSYLYQTPRPHAPSKIGTQTLSYDSNGNQVASVGTFDTGREITWNDLDQLTKEVDSGFTNTYLYNSAGERTHKRRTTLETVYVNQYYVIRNLLFQTKHIYAGPTRIATATKTLSSFNPPGGTAAPVLYYYHSDHLGSTGYLTDKNGVIVEHEEYLPSGEAWFEELRNGSATNRLPWKFNGKELDETGLYYYGARYYNPRAGVWLSPDPIFGGGVDEPGHLALYTYASNNPINLIDPMGLEDIPVNVGPKGANPGARFFADASRGSGGVVNFNDAASFDAAAKGHQTYRYDPQGGLDPDVATTLAGLKEAMGQPSGAWQSVVAGAGLANAAAPSDVRLDGTGSSKGLPGGSCESCRGSTATQVAYVAATVLTVALGAIFSAGKNAAARAGGEVASSAAQAARLSRQLASQEIAGGHAFVKHVVQRGEFPGIRTRAQFAEMVEGVMENASHVRHLSGGRTAFWRDGVVVIRNPSAVDGGTAFAPTNGFNYFLGLR